jgi:HEPN domain-containing protein
MLNAELTFKSCITNRTIEIIIGCVAPERIFCKDGFFLITLSNKSQRPLSDYKCIIETSVDGIKGNYSLLFASELEKQLDAGNLFYSSFCTTENVVYDGWQSPLPLTLNKRLQKVVENTSIEFYCGYNRAQAFFQGANFYFDHSNYSMSLFMLHQAIEQGLRSIINSICNQDVRTHSLMELKPHLKKCAPNLQHFFLDINEKLMILLEGAYSGCRYINNYPVEKKDAELLINLARRFLIELEKTFKKMLETFTPKQFLTNNTGK